MAERSAAREAAARIAAENGVPLPPAPEPTVDTDDIDTWLPIDLAPYLDGTVERPTPAIGLTRSDGLRLLYPGREHAVIGEMESGKSWVACACVAAELQAGRPVVYIHFEEADPTDTVERLTALGVKPSTMLSLLRFVGPEYPVNPVVLGALLDPAPSLVILDGVNEGMSLHTAEIMGPDGAATFRRRLVKPCTRAGAAVLLCDHVVKDPERRGRGLALGTVHKGNALSGALIVLENVEPFGRTMRGRSHVFVTKDRPGHLRRHGQSTKVSARTYMGEFVVDDTQTVSPNLVVGFYAPSTDTPAAELQPVATTRDDLDEVVWQAVTDIVADTKEPATTNTVTATVAYRAAHVRGALERLWLNKRLTREEGKRGAHLYRPVTSVSPTASQDHKESDL